MCGRHPWLVPCSADHFAMQMSQSASQQLVSSLYHLMLSTSDAHDCLSASVSASASVAASDADAAAPVASLVPAQRAPLATASWTIACDTGLGWACAAGCVLPDLLSSSSPPHPSSLLLSSSTA